MEELLTTKELCEWLKITRATAWRWREKGMPHIGTGKSIRYNKSDIIKWLAKQTQN